MCINDVWDIDIYLYIYIYICSVWSIVIVTEIYKWGCSILVIESILGTVQNDWASLKSCYWEKKKRRKKEIILHSKRWVNEDGPSVFFFSLSRLVDRKNCIHPRRFEVPSDDLKQLCNFVTSPIRLSFSFLFLFCTSYSYIYKHKFS